MSEQALLFQRAGMVVAPHGAGLANMVFAPPGLRVIELLPDGVMNWCYRHLAVACGHDCDCVIGRSAPAPGASRLWSGWTVSATHVLSGVEQAETHPGHRPELASVGDLQTAFST